MKLDARFVNIIYKIAEQDPPLTQEQQDIPEGALWLNEVTGKIFIALRHPEKKNKIVWLSLGGQEDYLKFYLDKFSTANIVDIFNDNSIVAFYPFDGNANDLANGYNGTWYGNESYAQGIFGRAARFGYSSTNFISIDSNDLKQKVKNGNIKTVSGWIYWSGEIPTKQISVLLHFAQCDSCGCCGFNIQINENGYLYIDYHASPCSDGIRVNNDSKFTIEPNVWYHIVSTERGVYLNGKLVHAFDDYTPLVKIGRDIDAVRIGANYCICNDCQNENTSITFKGLIDQLRIFNRTLTPEEILILYNENYLITEALKLLTHKLGGAKKEFIYIPGGDNIIKLGPNQPIDITGRAKIFKVTDPPPQVKESDYGKELYFPDNTAIAFTWDEDLTVPFTIFVRFKLDKVNNDIDAQLMGLDYGGQPPENKFDMQVFIGEGKLGVNIGAHNSELIEYPPLQHIEIIPNVYYTAFITIKNNSANLVVFGEGFENNKKEVMYTWDSNKPITQLYENKLALGGWIFTSDSENPNEIGWFANSGLHIQAFRIFKGELSEEDMLTIAKESTQKGVLLTEYLPQVKVYDTLDQKLEVFYNFDKIDATNKKIIDLSGKNRHGILKLANGENIQEAFVEGVFGKALNCKNIDKRATIQGLPTNVDFMTVCFWMYWTGEYNSEGDMPFGFYKYVLWLKDDKFGLNTGKGEIYGINGAAEKLKNRWVHICAVFPKQSTTNLANTEAELWINGEKQQINYVKGESSNNHSITSTVYISGWGYSSNYPFHGYIDQFRIYSRKLNPNEIKLLARERYYFYK